MPHRAATSCTESRVVVRSCPASAARRAWCGFRCFAYDGTEQTITLSVTARGAGSVCVYLDARGGAPAAILPVRPADGRQEITAAFAPEAGTHALFVDYAGSGYIDLHTLTIA